MSVRLRDALCGFAIMVVVALTLLVGYVMCTPFPTAINR